MKDKLSGAILNTLSMALIAACGTIAALYAASSAFLLPIGIGSIVAVGIVCALCFCAIFEVDKYGKVVRLVVLLVFLGLGALTIKTLILGAKGCTSLIWEIFRRELPSKVAVCPLTYTDEELEQLPKAILHFLRYLEAVTALFIAFSLNKADSPMLAALCAMPILMCSFILYSYPPDWMAISLALLFFGLLLLMSCIRNGDRKRMSISLMLVTPLVVLLLLAATKITEKLYENGYSIMDAKEAVTSRIDQLGEDLGQLLGGEEKPDRRNLNDVGDKEMTGKTVMYVNSSVGGSLYLRGYSLGVYKNNSWSSVTEPEGIGIDGLAIAATRIEGGTNASYDTVSIASYTNTRILFTPYFFSGTREGMSYHQQNNDAFYRDYAAGYETHEEYVSLSSNEDVYTVNYYKQSITPTGRLISEQITALNRYGDYVRSTYLQLPDETKAAMLEIADGLGISVNDGRDVIIHEVTEYVTNAAEYTLTPEKQPSNEDFAVYFLTVGRQGYCVHYATAAAVMLRALGIPARYVVGYRVSAINGRGWDKVTEDDAHAWVEVYSNDLGWIPIEVTGGDGAEPAPAYTQQPILATMEPTAEPTTEPTEEPTSELATEPTPSAPASDAPSDSASPKGTPDVSNSPDASSQASGAPDYLGGGVTKKPASAWWFLLLIPAFFLLVWGRRRLIIKNRRNRWRRSGNERCAVLAWNYLNRLSRYGVRADSEVYRIAQKATFSRSGVSDDERKQVLDAAERTVEQLNGSLTGVKRLAAKYVWALL